MTGESATTLFVRFLSGNFSRRRDGLVAKYDKTASDQISRENSWGLERIRVQYLAYVSHVGVGHAQNSLDYLCAMHPIHGYLYRTSTPIFLPNADPIS